MLTCLVDHSEQVTCGEDDIVVRDSKPPVACVQRSVGAVGKLASKPWAMADRPLGKRFRCRSIEAPPCDSASGLDNRGTELVNVVLVCSAVNSDKIDGDRSPVVP